MIPYGRQSISEADIEAVVEVLRSDLLTQGPVVPRFQRAICDYTGSGHAVAVNSATSALHLACRALDVGPGDTVWTSPISFVASANCALYCGAGVDFVDISAGIFEAPGAVMDPMYYQQGWNTYTSEEVKKNVNIPVITSHTLRDPEYCEKILAEGKTDMVGLSRQMIADPYWANKAFERRPQEIRKCISCLVGCWQESLMIKRHMRCAINPAVGDERFIHLKPAETATCWTTRCSCSVPRRARFIFHATIRWCWPVVTIWASSTAGT